MTNDKHPQRTGKESNSALEAPDAEVQEVTAEQEHTAEVAGEKEIRLPESAFLKRVKREARKILREVLGEDVSVDNLEELRALVEKARKFDELTKTQEEKLNETLSKLEREKLAMELELAELKRRDIFYRVANALGVKELDAAYKLLDWAEVDELSEEAVKRELEKTIKKYPFLAGKHAVSSQVGTIRQASGNENLTRTFTREELSRMTPEEINKNWQLISKLLAEGKI